jgi:site-specific DNA-adenine methylase
MQIKALFKYFGSKGDSARDYPDPLPGMPLIEPFAGSAGYARLHWDLPVFLVDIDPGLIACWKYIQQADPEELFALLRIDLQAGQTISDLPIPAEAKYLIRSWQRVGRNTTDTISKWGTPYLRYLSALPKITQEMGPEESAKILQTYMASGMWGERIICRILAERPKFQHWKFACGSYQKIPNTRGTWFIDPPYRGNVGGYNAGPDGIDFRDLRDWCLSREGLVIVCEQEGADWLPFEPLAKNRNRTKGDRTDAKMEMIWIKK